MKKPKNYTPNLDPVTEATFNAEQADMQTNDSVESYLNTLSPSEMVEYDDGSMDVVFDKTDENSTDADSDKVLSDVDLESDDNFAEQFSKTLLEEISDQVISQYESDKQSQEDWFKVLVDSLRLLGLSEDDGGTPLFDGACTSVHPLLLESVIKAQSKESQELLGKAEIVKTNLLGDETPELLEKSRRVKRYVNFQITYQMSEFRHEHDRQAFYKYLCGSGLKKPYYDNLLGRVRSINVPIDQFIISNQESDLETAYAYTQVMYVSPMDLKRHIATGLYSTNTEQFDEEDSEDAEGVVDELGVDDDDEFGLGTSYVEGLGKPSTPDVGEIVQRFGEITKQGIDTNQEVYTLLEQHTYLVLPEECGGVDDRPLPFIVTVDLNSRKVLSIRRNWEQGDLLKRKIVRFSHYPMIPGIGFYGLGYAQILANPVATMTAIQRSLVDSGQFANMKGGIRAKGLQLTEPDAPIAPGQFKEFTGIGVNDIDKALKVWNWGEPSMVLFQLLQWLDGRFQRFADNTEQVVQDSTNYGKVGTTLALLEASNQLFSAIMSRTHRAFQEELYQIIQINKETITDQLLHTHLGPTFSILPEDFDNAIDVVPVSDGNFSSTAHKLAVNQAKVDLASRFPNVFDERKICAEYLYDLGEPKPETYFKPDAPQAAPLSPLEDIQAASKGTPIKAFPGQDHQSHIKIKRAFLDDPLNGGQNPLMGQIAPVLQANIQEHMILDFQEKIAGIVGVTNGDDLKAMEAAAIAIAASYVKDMDKQIADLEEAGGAGSPEMIIALAEKTKADAQLLLAKTREQERMTNYFITAQKTELDVMEHHDKMALEGIKVKSNNLLKRLDSVTKILGPMMAFKSKGVDKPE